jgi:hypothetical protein
MIIRGKVGDFSRLPLIWHHTLPSVFHKICRIHNDLVVCYTVWYYWVTSGRHTHAMYTLQLSLVSRTLLKYWYNYW